MQINRTCEKLRKERRQKKKNSVKRTYVNFPNARITSLHNYIQRKYDNYTYERPA